MVQTLPTVVLRSCSTKTHSDNPRVCVPVGQLNIIPEWFSEAKGYLPYFWTALHLKCTYKTTQMYLLKLYTIRRLQAARVCFVAVPLQFQTPQKVLSGHFDVHNGVELELSWSPLSLPYYTTRGRYNTYYPRRIRCTSMCGKGGIAKLYHLTCPNAPRFFVVIDTFTWENLLFCPCAQTAPDLLPECNTVHGSHWFDSPQRSKRHILF